jgi:hypothetical protein
MSFAEVATSWMDMNVGVTVRSSVDRLTRAVKQRPVSLCRRGHNPCMADQDDVRRIAVALPETREAEDRFAFSVLNKGKQKGFVWAWNERVEPKKPRVPRRDVVAVRVVDQVDKEALIASDPKTFFTEPHYNGFPAVLVRLPVIGIAELEELIVDAWRCQAPKALVEAYERGDA